MKAQRIFTEEYPELLGHEFEFGDRNRGVEKSIKKTSSFLLCVCVLAASRVQLFATPWTVAHQVPLSMGFARQEYWNGLPFPPLADLPNPGSNPLSPVSPALDVDSLPLSHWGLF